MVLFAPPVREYDGRETLRSLADAIEKARDLDGLAEDEALVAKVTGLEMRDGRRIGFVILAGPKRADSSMLVIPMPSSSGFTALTPAGDRLPFPIHLLHEARAYGSGKIQLASGQIFRNVDLRTSALPEFDETDDEIVKLSVEFLGVKEQCYRELDPEEFPGFVVLDYALMHDVQVKRLKPVQHYVLKRLSNIPPSRVAYALRHSGMRMPRSSGK